MQQTSSKDSLRRAIQGRRSTLSLADWALDDTARTAHLLRALGNTPLTVALYASRAGEPGTDDAITFLHAAGWQVLLPVVGGPPGWAPFDGWDAMRPGWGGIPEPVTPRLAEDGLSLAEVVVVACLAVARDGTRLGTGGGWYDRTLPLRRPGVPVWALACAGEWVDTVPHEPHDVAIDAVITPEGVHACGETPVLGIGQWRRAELS